MSKFIKLPKEINPITKAAYFLAPLVGVQGAIIRDRFVNAYLGTDMAPDIEGNHIVLVVYNHQQKRRGLTYERFVEMVTSLDTFIGESDICSGKLGMYIFQVPEEFASEVELFKRGHYSKYDVRAKNLCIENVLYNGKLHQRDQSGEKLIQRIFRQDPILRKAQEKRFSSPMSPVDLQGAEIWEKPYKKKELLNTAQVMKWEEHLIDSFEKIRSNHEEAMAKKGVLGKAAG